MGFSGIGRSLIADDGGFFVVSENVDGVFRIEKYSAELSPLGSIRLDTEGSHPYPWLHRYRGKYYVFTHSSLEDEATLVDMRSFASDLSSISSARVVLRTESHFTGTVSATTSADSSKVLFWGIGKFQDSVSEDKRRSRIAPLMTAVADFAGDKVLGARKDLYYSENADRFNRTAVVSDDGTGTILEVHSPDGEEMLLTSIRVKGNDIDYEQQRIVTRRDSVVAGSENDDYLRGGQIAAVVRNDNSVTALMNLTDRNFLVALLRISVPPEGDVVNLDIPIVWTEGIIRRLFPDEGRFLERDLDITRVLERGIGLTVILQSSKVTGGSPSSMISHGSVVNGNIVILDLAEDGSIRSSRVIPRLEKWTPGGIASFESGYSHFIQDNSIYFLVRERAHDGIMLYSVPLEGDRSIVGQQILRLGNMSYFGRNYTIWHNPREFTLFSKGGQFGTDWSIVRIGM